jgi:hypothetical protein
MLDVHPPGAPCLASQDMGYDSRNPYPGAPMLDVHPPHAPTHTWKDFFLHIATIVIGLLIAIGLEQTVEYIHHRNQVAEARQALLEERDQNKGSFARATRSWRFETTRFQANLAVLLYIQQHPGASPASRPGQINWHNSNYGFPDAAWEIAQHDNITELMPQAEVRNDQLLYKQLAIVEESYHDRLRATGDARQYQVQDGDPAHFSPAELAHQIALARLVLEAHYRIGGDLRNLNARYPDFTPAPTTPELNDIMHEPRTEDYLHPWSPELHTTDPLTTNP